jgi:acyl-coenzyme A synthetase/AMP-(fatty) acid ligase
MVYVGDVAFVRVGLLIGARHVFIDNPLQLGLTVAALAAAGVAVTELAPSMLALLAESDAREGMTFPCLRWVLTGGATLDPGMAARAAVAVEVRVITQTGDAPPRTVTFRAELPRTATGKMTSRAWACGAFWSALARSRRSASRFRVCGLQAPVPEAVRVSGFGQVIETLPDRVAAEATS